MGFFSKITRAITKPIKKVIKSPIGRAALLGGLGYLGGAQAGLWGPKAAGSKMGWMKALSSGWKGMPFGTTLPGQESTITGIPGLLYKGAKFARANPALTVGAGVGLGTAAMAAGQPKVDELQGIGDSQAGHQAYLRARGFMPFGDPNSAYYTDPMWTASQGGRVKAQQGMYAGQGQGITSIQTDARADPGSLSEIDRPTEQGVLDTGTTEQSDDARLIQLIQQLAALGIPMEQLRGRTEQELVEMMVYLSSQMGSQQGGGRAQMARGGDNSLFLEESSEVIRGGEDGDSVVDETENIEVASAPTLEDSRNEMALQLFGKPIHELTEEELMIMDEHNQSLMNKGGIARTAYAMGTEHPVIPSKDGKQLDMRDTGGYQPHGKAEKHDDVRALLAQGEFVMTSDAVKGLGGGDREAGAKKMYDMMHNLEAMA